MNKSNKISVVAIFLGIGDIDIQRGYRAPKTYHYSWRRAAMLRRAVMDNFQYTSFCNVMTEKYRIAGKITVK